jgi:16S rRNA (cytosine967-C5)-methyltransferase
MTPAARVSAAIDILDDILAGGPAEKVLTRWGRANRYAGSGDRAAIRDHVFSALRCKRSFAYLGGGETGRGLMVGASFALGWDRNALFTGEKYSPAPLTNQEASPPDLTTAALAVQLDCPDWLYDHFQQSLAEQTVAVLQSLQRRAPVFLRVNLGKADIDSARDALLADGIATAPHPLAETALEVLENPRRVAQSAAYRDGLVELQDAASQAVVQTLPLAAGQNVLDYCAGGGGKTLAIAARADVRLSAHDLSPQRLRDLPARAKRAGVEVAIADAETLAGKKFDLVLCDVPCSGSGAWRRAPDAKWSLSPESLGDYIKTQAQVMDKACEYVSAGGGLAYVTCSLFRHENQAQTTAFLARNPAWRLVLDRQFTPLMGGDGFYVAIFERVQLV